MRSVWPASPERRGYRCPPPEKRNGAFACSSSGLLKKAGSSASRGEKIAPKPDKVAVCLATRLHNFPNRESFLRGRHFFLVTPRAALPCASAAVRRAAAASEMDLILIAISRLVHAPLIDCGCRQNFLHPSQAGCATNARWRAAPQSPQERNVAIVMNDAARQRLVRKFVAGRPAPIAQRRANACASFGRQHMPVRYDWLTRLRTARSGWTWHPLLALRG
jgi:hypothetical protein